MTADAAEAAPFLHVANGTATTRLIEAAGIPGITSIWADPLHDGPVPGGLTDAELLEVRRRHLGDDAAAVDPVNDLRRWRDVIARVDTWGELVLWYEHDLFDQLNLVQLLTWVADRVPARSRVSLVCIGAFPGRPVFRGLGELTPGEIASLLPQRQTVTDVQYRLAQRAWLAFRDPTPEALERLRRGDTVALPFLGAAIARFLQELPWTTDGLSRTERHLMQLASTGPIDLTNAFPRMQDGEDAYYVTDRSLWQMATDLSTGARPLMILTNPGPASEPLRGSVVLTQDGRDVLEGRIDRVHHRGFNRWFGGAYLQSGRNLWRWDEERKTVRLTTV